MTKLSPLTPYELRQLQFEIDPQTGKRRMADPEFRKMWQEEAQTTFGKKDHVVTTGTSIVERPRGQ